MATSVTAQEVARPAAPSRTPRGSARVGRCGPMPGVSSADIAWRCSG